MKLFGPVSIAALAMALASCGGGDSSSAPPATGGGVAAPAPTPSPTPTPTPTPTQSATTTTAFDDLTGDQVFDAACARGASSELRQQIIRFDEGFTFAFADATDSWTVAGETPDGTIGTSFAPSDIVQSEEGILTLYQRASVTGTGPSEIFAFGVPQWPNLPANFVRGGFVQSALENGSVASFNCVFGVPTALNDVVPAATINFSQEIDAAGTLVVFDGLQGTSFDLAPTTFTASADPATGLVMLTIALRGTEFSFDPNTGQRIDSTEIVEFGSVSGNASISDQEQAMVGDLAGEGTSSQSGLFSGWFFGPQGAELGITISGSEQRIDGTNTSFSLGITGTQDQQGAAAVSGPML